MVKAYVLIETAVGELPSVAKTLKLLKGVQTVDIVTGPYDIIALVEGRDLNETSEIVTSHMHTIPGIIRTLTCVSLNGRTGN